VARDTQDDTQRLIGMGAKSDLLLISGGVSAGRYDVVERSLAALGANFYFDRVLIQPGQPLVFGRLGETFFFGLPGNPASTMVCFELFARAALELLGGAAVAPLPLLESKLAAEFSHKPGLTRFLPAELAPDGATVAPVAWQGSSDIAALARANAFLVAAPDKPRYAAGETIRVLPR
jgi:molybdopterin molybdotransferase